MNFRYKLTNFEWDTLALTPLWIFPTMALADGKFDEKEKNALFIISKNINKFNNTLLQEIFDYYNNNFDSILSKFYEDNRNIKKGLKDVADILETKVPTDIATNFKKIMIAIAYYIANASGDEFTGKVSPRERKTLVELANSLKFNILHFEEKPTLYDIITLLEK